MPDTSTARTPLSVGTFTGPAGSCWLDGQTNYWFKANASALAGGATKVVLTDVVP